MPCFVGACSRSHGNSTLISHFKVLYVRCCIPLLQPPGQWNGGKRSDIATMLEEDMEVAIKVVVVGNGAVGKSSMIQRYCKGIFTKDYKKTIGVDFLERQIV